MSVRARCSEGALCCCSQPAWLPFSRAPPHFPACAPPPPAPAWLSLCSRGGGRGAKKRAQRRQLAAHARLHPAHTSKRYRRLAGRRNPRKSRGGSNHHARTPCLQDTESGTAGFPAAARTRGRRVPGVPGLGPWGTGARLREEWGACEDVWWGWVGVGVCLGTDVSGK